jgi:hypothetical protein
MSDKPFSIERLIFNAFEKQKKRYKGNSQEFENKFKKRLPKIIEKLNSSLRKDIMKFCSGEIRRKYKDEKQLAKNIGDRYKESFTLLDIFIEFNLQVGRDFYRKYYKLFKNSYDDQLKLDTLVEIHSRACQVASEIKLLVKNGYADGAHARWRSLHELCITFLFLYDHDHNVVKMYLDYLIIESCDKIRKYQVSYPKLGWKPIAEKEIKSIESKRQHLIDKYGKDFAKSHGWTMSILPAGQRTIRGIEEHVQMDHLRGIYSWASENVHAGISGNRTRLGLPINAKNKFLAGPSELGLFDPIQFTTYSLMEMSDTFLNAEDSIMNKIYYELLGNIRQLLIEQLSTEEKAIRRRKNKKSSSIIGSVIKN